MKSRAAEPHVIYVITRAAERYVVNIWCAAERHVIHNISCAAERHVINIISVWYHVPRSGTSDIITESFVPTFLIFLPPKLSKQGFVIYKIVNGENIKTHKTSYVSSSKMVRSTCMAISTSDAILQRLLQQSLWILLQKTVSVYTASWLVVNVLEKVFHTKKRQHMGHVLCVFCVSKLSGCVCVLLGTATWVTITIIDNTQNRKQHKE